MWCPPSRTWGSFGAHPQTSLVPTNILPTSYLLLLNNRVSEDCEMYLDATRILDLCVLEEVGVFRK